MPFIGAQPATTFAKATSQVFTNANGSIVTFTLNKHVAQAEDIEVFVANIQQQPTTSYTIDSDGVTLRFSEAPPSGDFYVVYRNLAQQTGIDTGAFRKTGGALSGTVSNFTSTGIDDNADATSITIDSSENVGIGTTSPTSPLGTNFKVLDINSGVWGGNVNFSGNQGGYIGNRHSGNPGLGYYAVSGQGHDFAVNGSTTSVLNIDSNGFITTSKQPLFEVTSSTNQAISNSTLTKTTLWDTKVHDHNNNFDTSTDQFTAPVAGSYLMTCTLTLSTMVAGAGIGIVWTKQSTGGSMNIFKHPYHQSTEINITHTLTATTIMTLAANDKIELHVFQGSGYSESLTNSNVFSGSNSSSQNWQGFLIG